MEEEEDLQWDGQRVDVHLLRTKWESKQYEYPTNKGQEEWGN